MSKARELAELGAVYDSGALSNRNLLINGAMQVSQRGSSFTAPNNVYTLDRFQVFQATGAVFDVKTSTDAPDGFESSLEIDCTTAAASPAAGAYFQMVQRIEGYNVQQFAYGTSSAKKITLSFYVKSNKTGTYQVNFRKTASTAQMANKTYTINSANTWERKSVTVDGATGFSLTGGNVEGFMVDWWYHSGTDYTSGSGSETYIAASGTNYNAYGTANLGDSTSNYLRMTGVQLEVGTEATPFEHRSFGQELALCERYFQKYNYSSNINTADTQNTLPLVAAYAGDTGYAGHKLTATMRTSPTFSASAANTWQFYSGGASLAASEMTAYETGPSMWGQKYVATSNFTGGYAVYGRALTTSSYYQFDAEI